MYFSTCNCYMGLGCKNCENLQNEINSYTSFANESVNLNKLVLFRKTEIKETEVILKKKGKFTKIITKFKCMK